MRFFVECAFPYLGKRRATSRKSAFWEVGVTEKCILRPTTYVKTHSMPQRTYRARFFVRDVARVHLCVMSQSQSALFGEGL